MSAPEGTSGPGSVSSPPLPVYFETQAAASPTVRGGPGSGAEQEPSSSAGPDIDTETCHLGTDAAAAGRGRAAAAPTAAAADAGAPGGEQLTWRQGQQEQQRQKQEAEEAREAAEEEAAAAASHEAAVAALGGLHGAGGEYEVTGPVDAAGTLGSLAGGVLGEPWGGGAGGVKIPAQSKGWGPGEKEGAHGWRVDGMAGWWGAGECAGGGGHGVWSALEVQIFRHTRSLTPASNNKPRPVHLLAHPLARSLLPACPVRQVPWRPALRASASPPRRPPWWARRVWAPPWVPPWATASAPHATRTARRGSRTSRRSCRPAAAPSGRPAVRVVRPVTGCSVLRSCGDVGNRSR